MHKTRYTNSLLFAVLTLIMPFAAYGQIFFSVTVAPPPLPVYEQPVIPQAGYLWTPGYWHWSDEGYYWVPGTWVQPPMSGVLWTPGYWGWGNGAYQFNQGYWGPQVGYYGGVNYGFGFGGLGFGGGEWRGGAFFYNTAVMNVGGNTNNVYVNKTVIENNTNNNSHVSYHGGAGGTTATPTPAEEQAAHGRHIQPTAEQTQHQAAASKNPKLLAKNNGGKPEIAATAKAGDFSEKSAVPAKEAGGEVNPESLKATAKTMPAREKVSEEKASQEKASEEKATENKAAQEKASQEKATENKAAQEKASEKQAPHETAPREKAPHESAPHPSAPHPAPPKKENKKE